MKIQEEETMIFAVRHSRSGGYSLKKLKPRYVRNFHKHENHPEHFGAVGFVLFDWLSREEAEYLRSAGYTIGDEDLRGYWNLYRAIGPKEVRDLITNHAFEAYVNAHPDAEDFTELDIPTETERNFGIDVECVTCGQGIRVVTDAGTTDPNKVAMCSDCQTAYKEQDTLPLSGNSGRDGASGGS